MEEQILVSIVVPVYNMGATIKRSVESLINQTYKNIEIILVDDGSVDDSLVACQRIADKDNRIYVVHTENQGSGLARNEGIIRAKGKYIYFPDADDILDEKAIEILTTKIEQTEADLVVFGYQSISPNEKIVSQKKYINTIVDGAVARSNYRDYYGNQHPFSIQGAPWNKFFRLDVIRNNNVKYPPLRRHQDEAFIARYVTHCQTIQFIEEVLYTYYENDINKQWDKYPLNYIDAVVGLFEDRHENLLAWEPNDHQTHDAVYREFICNTIKALELSFSSKFGFKRKERLLWIKNKIAYSKIAKFAKPQGLGWYQSIILCMIKSGLYSMIYYSLKFKIEIHDK